MINGTMSHKTMINLKLMIKDANLKLTINIIPGDFFPYNFACIENEGC